jgi:hypothetical protein
MGSFLSLALDHIWRYDVGRMKPQPAPNVPGDTEAERMSNALRMVLSVSKKELLKEEAKRQRATERRKRRKVQNDGKK